MLEKNVEIDSDGIPLAGTVCLPAESGRFPTVLKITIFHLLTHTSGIPNLTDFPDFRTTIASPETPKELLARFRDKPLEFAPGEKHRYSNSGYLLLGYLLETISGQPYADFVAQQVLQPLGMKDSGYDSSAAILPRRAAGYRRRPDPKDGDHGPPPSARCPLPTGQMALRRGRPRAEARSGLLGLGDRKRNDVR